MLAPAKSLKTTLFVVGLIALILLALLIVVVANKTNGPRGKCTSERSSITTSSERRPA